MVQAGSNEVIDRSLMAIIRAIITAFRGLGRLVGMEWDGIQVVLSSVPSMAGRDTERIRKTHLINTWLRGWHH